jgi:lipopolysaccharide biosynthesis protein
MTVKRYFRPSHHVEQVDADPFKWRAKNDDPQFEIESVEGIKDAWVVFKVDSFVPSAPSNLLKLYIDNGTGYSEDAVLHIPCNANGSVSYVFHLDATLVNLRLDPVDREIEFVLKSTSVEPISKRRILWQFIRHKSLTGYQALTSTLGASWQRARQAADDPKEFASIVRELNLLAEHSKGVAKTTEDTEANVPPNVEQFLIDLYKAPKSGLGWNTRFVPKTQEAIDFSSLKLRLIAFYLPQFHAIPENDLWWGKGFTDWTNVTKAMPQYPGHHQPQLPVELGFYDLRSVDTMRAQAELARLYGVHGFCIHHYWFGGRQLLETPLRNLLRDKSIDINFCLCWANENWTRRWDGLDQDVLMAQNHSPEDDLAFLESLTESFRDKRYIRVDNKPVLVVYRASLLPDAKATAARWRKRIVELGFPGIYLIATRAFDTGDPRDFGFDASVEFPPHKLAGPDITRQVVHINKDNAGQVYDFPEMAHRAGKVSYADFRVYKTVMPSWDNEARKPGLGISFANADPLSYAHWLRDAAEQTAHNREPEQLLFVNAWNEWAEGAHLEPDRRFGYGFLHATANVLRDYLGDETSAYIKKLNSSFQKHSKVAIILHVFYEDLIGEILNPYLASAAKTCDVFVSVKADISRSSLDRLKQACPNIFFVSVRNIGRDIRPFLIAYKKVAELGYEIACKLHTKKSPHLIDGEKRRNDMFEAIVGSRETVESAIQRFKAEPKLGVLAPKGYLTDLSETSINKGNRYWLDILLKRMGAEDLIGTYQTKFPAGSMYWFRVSALRCLLDPTVIDIDSFELEAGQLDGTLAHAIERIISLAATQDGQFVDEMSIAGARSV